MKCERCGTEMGRDQTLETHQPGGSGMLGGGQIVAMTLCRGCANNRQLTRQFYLWTAVALASGIVVLICLGILGVV